MNTNETNGTEPTKNLPEGGKAEEVTSSTPPVENAAPAVQTTTEQTAEASETAPAETIPGTPAEAIPEEVNVTGKIRGEVKVPIGTKVKDALKKMREGIETASLTLREAVTSKAVSLDRVLNASLSVTATEKASGG
jgi:hypothetical protein